MENLIEFLGRKRGTQEQSLVLTCLGSSLVILVDVSVSCLPSSGRFCQDLEHINCAFSATIHFRCNLIFFCHAFIHIITQCAAGNSMR
jgi:hypothetical protein